MKVIAAKVKSNASENQVEPPFHQAESDAATIEPSSMATAENESSMEKESLPSPRLSNRILLLHGSNNEMKEKVVGVLTQLGFEIIISEDNENYSKPLTQKMTEYSDISFVVVVLSFDVYWYWKDQKPKDAKLCAHQNIVFELGYMIGKFTRNKVLVLYDEKKNFELPSNFFNAYYIPYDKERVWHTQLIKALNDHGYKMDIKQLRFH